MEEFIFILPSLGKSLTMKPTNPEEAELRKRERKKLREGGRGRGKGRQGEERERLRFLARPSEHLNPTAFEAVSIPGLFNVI